MREGLLASRWRGLMILTSIGAAALATRYACDRRFVSNPPPEQGPRAAELADRIDPNTADWQALAALPGLGEKRARELVAQRQDWLATHPNQIRFRKLDDLRMSGVGDATLERMEPFLIFPPAATAPAKTPALTRSIR